MADRSGKFRRYLSIRLEHVSRAACDLADEVYRREFGLNIRELRVLRVLAEEPGLTSSAVAQRAMFERTLASRLIGQLVKRGLAVRRICDEDARQMRLSLADAGVRMVEAADRLGDALNEDLLSVLTEAQRETFDQCLQQLMTWQPRGLSEQARSAAHAANAIPEPTDPRSDERASDPARIPAWGNSP